MTPKSKQGKVRKKNLAEMMDEIELTPHDRKRDPKLEITFNLPKK